MPVMVDTSQPGGNRPRERSTHAYQAALNIVTDKGKWHPYGQDLIRVNLCSWAGFHPASPNWYPKGQTSSAERNLTRRIDLASATRAHTLRLGRR